ncbi:MAG: hypothetical protein CL933_19125 [Deltaproteobacteria bacterium]|jgi:hypothetical protein|nr:hypothetical protein [Deltaproteobacteria bacterium]|tara:strand:+ start:30 stop:251 length:222 start_codon:yes stop_codon:yes gene_type:complete
MGEIITDKAVMRATGKTWNQWFEELEDSPSKDMGESAVQAWLTEHHTNIGGWWCQVITRRWESKRVASAAEHS